MAPAEESLGTRIKRAREVRRWTQRQLALRLGVDRKTVDNWENDRTQPRSSLGALEAILCVNLTNGSGVIPYTEPDEVAIWDMDQFTENERRELIQALRQIRSR